MKIFDGLKTFFSKSIGVNENLLIRGYDTPGVNHRDFVSLSQTGYNNCAVVFRCINLIAQCFSNLTWIVLDNNNVEIKNHPALELINNPNISIGKTKFLWDSMAFLLLGGNLFLLANMVNNKQTVKELLYLRNDLIEIQIGQKMHEVKKYVYNNKEIFNPSDVLHIKLFNPLDNVYGLSPLQSCAINVDTINTSQRWNYNLMKNSGKPSFSITPTENTKMPLTPRQKQEIENEIQNMYTGAQSAGKPMIFRLPLLLKHYGLNPSELHWLEGKKDAKLDVCNAYGVPPELVGIQEHKTYSNQKEARKALYQDAVLPIADLFVDEVNLFLKSKKMLDKNENLRIAKAKINALQTDKNVMADASSKLVVSGQLTPNDAREYYLNLERIDKPEMDAFYMKNNITPIEITGDVNNIDEEE